MFGLGGRYLYSWRCPSWKPGSFSTVEPEERWREQNFFLSKYEEKLGFLNETAEGGNAFHPVQFFQFSASQRERWNVRRFCVHVLVEAWTQLADLWSVFVFLFEQHDHTLRVQQQYLSELRFFLNSVTIHALRNCSAKRLFNLIWQWNIHVGSVIKQKEAGSISKQIGRDFPKKDVKDSTPKWCQRFQQNCSAFIWIEVD